MTFLSVLSLWCQHLRSFLTKGKVPFRYNMSRYINLDRLVRFAWHVIDMDISCSIVPRI